MRVGDWWIEGGIALEDCRHRDDVPLVPRAVPRPQSVSYPRMLLASYGEGAPIARGKHWTIRRWAQKLAMPLVAAQDLWFCIPQLLD